MQLEPEPCPQKICKAQLVFAGRHSSAALLAIETRQHMFAGAGRAAGSRVPETGATEFCPFDLDAMLNVFALDARHDHIVFLRLRRPRRQRQACARPPISDASS